MEENILLLGLLAIITILIVLKRKSFTWYKFMFPLFYFGMYKTKKGMLLMKQTAKKYRNFLIKFQKTMITVAFAGMILVSFDFLRTIYLILTRAEGIGSVGVVLPIQAKGVFYVPLIYWIICVAFIATIHEFAHGVYACLHKIKVKSSGFAFLGILVPIIPAAFVEPEEKQLYKSKKIKQLSVYAAGPIVNITFGILFLLIFSFITNPFIEKNYLHKGVEIVSLYEGNTPAKIYGLKEGEVITKIDNYDIRTTKDFTKALEKKPEGSIINLATGNFVREITLAKNPLLGINVKDSKELINNTIAIKIINWFNNLIYWLFLLNLGVGLFNLVPIGPLDGGRIIHAVLQKYFQKSNARKVWYGISAIFLTTLLTSLAYSFIR